ncbi:FAD dependent oxidoreductase [Rhizodiscina lignyota]|uniref:FAD dependent oxidoreductase n=1 Tax=Rhizodiscina lignyota TaxID=1504668 RepID=A0A9P4M5G6_9PEZI|nr:FAD dependent oxidoreductase [Rhizodiscina lignyota]
MAPVLTFWKDLNTDPAPLKQQPVIPRHILVIGGGVSGLVTAWCLLDKGYKVTILAREWANTTKNGRLTAQIAGALWEYPPAVCGSHTNETSLAYSKSWAMIAYHIWYAIANTAGLNSGVRVMPARFFFPYAIEEDRRQYLKMKGIEASGVQDFVHDSKLADSLEIDPDYGVKDAYQHQSIIIDTDQAMEWLTVLVKAKGASFALASVDQDLLLLEDALRLHFFADAIVNCSGLGSKVLANDTTCYPLRGALLRLVNDGKDFPKINSALAISADAAQKDNGIIFLVPRNENILILGGIAQAGEEKLDLTLDSPAIQEMRKRCEEFMPCLKNAKLDPDYPLAQGLRPARKDNIRVERELRARANGKPSRVVHNYGHGGSGWSLSFGCAAEVVELIEEALAEIPPSAMATLQKAKL